MTGFSRRTYLKTCGAASIVGLAGCLGGDDDDDEDAFPTEEITWIVPYGEGGGFDTYAREALAQGWEDVLADETGQDVDIVIDNQPGGGGVQGNEQVYSADGDGHTIGMANIPGFVQNQLFQDVNYDMTEMPGLGRFTQSVWHLLMDPDNAVDDVEELSDWDEVSFGNTGVGSTGWYTTVVLADHYDINHSIVSGYDSLATDAPQSVLQGENDALIAPFANTSGFLEDGDLVSVLAWADEEVTATFDAPITGDISGLEAWANAFNVSRVAVTSPGVDDDIVETLSDTLWEVIGSDEYEDWGIETNNPVNQPADGAAVDDLILDSFDQLEDFEDVIQAEFDEEGE